jgi:hypothetical protein
VLGPKDVEDVQKWGAVNRIDFVAASFVQVLAHSLFQLHSLKFTSHVEL